MGRASGRIVSCPAHGSYWENDGCVMCAITERESAPARDDDRDPSKSAYSGRDAR